MCRFYTDDFFTPMPSLEDDAIPMANLIRARVPDLLTVAFDPEGTGPDTHYKVLLVSEYERACNIGSAIAYSAYVCIGRSCWFASGSSARRHSRLQSPRVGVSQRMV